ncbi:hypothetical protein PG997_005172 [Apiospora hydei]|uniref:Uncharacterized protein n=1 Tax=Apiospora hydei TaxID=1337664 RepID=A0ABR1X477_9PEZI
MILSLILIDVDAAAIEAYIKEGLSHMSLAFSALSRLPSKDPAPIEVAFLRHKSQSFGPIGGPAMALLVFLHVEGRSSERSEPGWAD